MATNDNWLEDLAAFIANQGGGVVAETIFVVDVPDDQDPSAITAVLVPQQGSPPERTAKQRYPRLQLSHRCENFLLAFKEATRMAGVLNAQRSMRLGTDPPFTCITSCAAQSEPYLLGRDGNNCWVVACSYELTLSAD